MNTNSIGSVSELAVAKALMERGNIVSFVFGMSQPYDLVVDIDNKLYKVEVKTGRLKKGKIQFRTCSVVRGKTIWASKAADLYGIYCPELDKVYLLPIHLAGNTVGTLRVDPRGNGSKKGILMASDFVV